jgi:ParB family chromosome partitioning protein
MKVTLSQYQQKFDRLRSAYHELRGYGSIDPEDVIPDPERERPEYSPEALDALGEDIKVRGQIMPIRVYWSGKHGRWVIVHGERRWQAIRTKDLYRINCIFLDGEPSEEERITDRLVDDLLREDMPPISVAKSFRKLMDLNSWTAADLSRKLHVSKGTVSRSLALLELPSEIQDSVESGKLAASTAYQISKAPDQEQAPLARQAIAQKLTRDETSSQVPTKRKAKVGGSGAKRSIRASNGLSVSITHKRRFTDEQAVEALQEMIDVIRAGKKGVA